MQCIVAVDPGRQKCGIAVMSVKGNVIERRVVQREKVLLLLAEWQERYSPAALILGDRTGSADFVKEVEASGLDQEMPIHLVDEHLSTLEARQRYFVEHPPTGLRRLIPVTMQSPPEPYDDYVAVILGERYLASQRP